MKHIPNFVTIQVQGSPVMEYKAEHLKEITASGQPAVLVTESNAFTVVQYGIVQFSSETEEVIDNLNEYMHLLMMQYNVQAEMLALYNQRAELEEKLYDIRQQRQILKEDLAEFGSQKSQQPKTIGDLLALYVRTN